MSVTVSAQSIDFLPEYARISIAFQVTDVLDISEEPGGIVLSERPIEIPYVKDYDAQPDGGPLRWPERFDLSHWGFFAAREEAQCLGGAAVAFDTPGLDMLRGRSDEAHLWDLRVRPEARGRGVGSALFRAAQEWAISKGCRRLTVETQNINAPACRFYQRMGCQLDVISHFDYPDHPDEIQLLWSKRLDPP